MTTASATTNPYGIPLQHGWMETTLGQLTGYGEGCIQTGPFGSQLHAHDYKSEGTPVVMPQQLGDNQILLDGIARISDQDRDRLVRHVMREGDIVFSRRGDVTRRSYIRSSEAGWLCGTGCLLIRVKHPGCDNRYLARFLSLPQFKDYITLKAVGATMPNLNQGILNRVPVILPQRSVQERIVDVLSAYDDLIQNNRRRMALLKEAAKSLYEEWFVRLRFPGHEHTKIINGVPGGWERKVIADYYDTSSGGTPSRKKPEYFEGQIPWVKTGELLGGILIDTEEKITEQAVEDSSAKFFPRRTVLVALYGATVGALGILAMAATTNQACCAVISTDKSLGFAFAYLTLAYNKHRLVGLSAGAAQKNISQQLVRDFPLLVPRRAIMEAFNALVEPFFDQIENLERQNQKARAARDLLLPHLMSGDVQP